MTTKNTLTDEIRDKFIAGFKRRNNEQIKKQLIFFKIECIPAKINNEIGVIYIS